MGVCQVIFCLGRSVELGICLCEVVLVCVS